MSQSARYQNTNPTKALLQFLTPSKIEVVLYIILAAILLLVVKHTVILNSLINSSQVSPQDFVVSDGTTIVVYKVTNAFSYVSSFLLWLFLGSSVYMGFWLFRNTTRTVVSDLKIGVAGGGQKNRSYWGSVGKKYAAALAVCISLVCYSYFFLRLTNRLVLDTSTGFYALTHHNFYLWLILSVILLAVLLYIFKLLFHSLFYIVRSFTVS